MAFESLTEKITSAFSKLKGKGVLSEKDIDEALREIKLSLLEADVNFIVVKEFVDRIKERTIGTDIHKSLNPAQQVIKCVSDELTVLLGGESSKIVYSNTGITIIMLVGLQGTGKTTTAGKLALLLRKKGKTPLLCSLDVYRPAAISQLEIIAKEINIPIHVNHESKKPLQIAKEAVRKAEIENNNVLILDTAGRLQIDDDLMNELSSIKKEIKPNEILLTIDALSGADVYESAKGFSDKIGIDGLILTKLDGDSRGGAALSAVHQTNKPIKFAGMGEKMSDLEEFYPDRMAKRILGMGDVLSLIEKATDEYDEQEAKKLEEKIKKNAFTLDDFLKQTSKIKKMGGITGVISMLPGANKLTDEQVERSEKEFKVMEAIAGSMTQGERFDPTILNASRRKRIAMGSGTHVSDVNSMIGRFEQSKKMIKKMQTKGGMREISKMFGGNMPKM